jgi:hypothetical protein
MFGACVSTRRKAAVVAVEWLAARDRPLGQCIGIQVPLCGARKPSPSTGPTALVALAVTSVALGCAVSVCAGVRPTSNHFRRPGTRNTHYQQTRDNSGSTSRDEGGSVPQRGANDSAICAALAGTSVNNRTARRHIRGHFCEDLKS